MFNTFAQKRHETLLNGGTVKYPGILSVSTVNDQAMPGNICICLETL